MPPSHSAVAFVRAGLEPLADGAYAAKMRSYLKTDMPMFGVRKPDQRPIHRDLVRRFAPEDRDAWEATVRALWAGPERELKYAAIAYAKAFRRRRFLSPTSVPLLEDLVRDGAWWDLVDDIAVHLAGEVVLRHREAMGPVLDRWIADDDLWIRRTALLAQLRHKEAADLPRLFRYCRRCAPDTSFWIRKAIGWSLRQQARTHPDEVRAFLADMGDGLSGLSRREASKHL